MKSTDEQNTRYRNALCGDCGEKPYSAGRTRCNECHRAWLLAGCQETNN